MKVKVHCHGEFLITQLHLLTITYKFLIVPNANSHKFCGRLFGKFRLTKSMGKWSFFLSEPFNHKHLEQPCRDDLGVLGNSLLRGW